MIVDMVPGGLYERQYILKFLFTSCLETRESWKMNFGLLLNEN